MFDCSEDDSGLSSASTTTSHVLFEEMTCLIKSRIVIDKYSSLTES